MKWLEPIECVLALISLISLIGFALADVALAALLVLWPFGVSPTTHPNLWRAALMSCLLTCAGTFVPHLICRLIRAVRRVVTS